MTSNEERREVAARLRDFDSLRETFRESSLCAFLDALGIEGYLDWEDVWGYLADLIEPEPERTCRMEYSKEKGYVICSNCGEKISAYTCEWTEPMEYSYPFCYACGAKVVEQ